MDKPDLLILGLDRQAIEIGLAVATLGGKVVVACGDESGLVQAIRDGELLARLVTSPDPTVFEARRKAVIEEIRRQRSVERLRAARMRVEPGLARFLDRRRMAIGEAVFQPRRILIGTGRESIGPLHELRALFETGQIPRRVILRGSSVAALDLASLLLRLGTQVSLLAEESLASELDPDGLRLLMGDLERCGLVRLAAMPAARPADLPVWEFALPRPALEGLGLAEAGLRLNNGELVLRRGFETSLSRVFAVGRAATPATPADPGAVAHLIGRMFFRRSGAFRPMPVLRLSGGDPGLAELGLSEHEAFARGDAQVLRASFSDADPAEMAGGFVKLIADRKGLLLGAALYGPQASERIAPLTLALSQGLTLSEIARLPFPPGVAGEAIRLAAASPGRALLRSTKIQRAFRFFRIFG